MQVETLNILASLPARFTNTGLSIGGFSVVETWERPIQRKLCSVASRRGGKILEVGYGMGMASTHIRQSQPQEHWIIEAHPDVAAKARLEVSQQPGVTLIEDLWQNIVMNFPSRFFDGIVFDAYPLVGGFDGSTDATLGLIADFLPLAVRILIGGGTLAFVDFSLEAAAPLSELTVNTFTSLKEHVVNVRIPDGCSYASGEVSHVIELTEGWS